MLKNGGVTPPMDRVEQFKAFEDVQTMLTSGLAGGEGKPDSRVLAQSAIGRGNVLQLSVLINIT